MTETTRNRQMIKRREDLPAGIGTVGDAPAFTLALARQEARDDTR